MDIFLEEACARLRAGSSPAIRRKVLRLLGLDPDEPDPGPEPDLADLASRYTAEVPENARCGAVTFTAELDLLGQRRTLHLRYAYAGEFGHYPEAFDGFGMLGHVGQLDVLTWPDAGGVAKWGRFELDLLDRAMLEAIDELIVAAEAPR